MPANASVNNNRDRVRGETTLPASMHPYTPHDLGNLNPRAAMSPVGTLYNAPIHTSVKASMDHSSGNNARSIAASAALAGRTFNWPTVNGPGHSEHSWFNWNSGNHLNGFGSFWRRFFNGQETRKLAKHHNLDNDPNHPKRRHKLVP